MIPEIVESEPSVSEAKLSELEKKYKFTFPSQYKSFLLRHNGGKPVPSCFSFGEGPYSGSHVDWFLAVFDGEDDNFEDYYQAYKLEQGARIPVEMIPIAHDPGGNLVCIAVSGPQTGEVFFWDHERELDESEPNNFLIAKSFDEFLEGLDDGED